MLQQAAALRHAVSCFVTVSCALGRCAAPTCALPSPHCRQAQSSGTLSLAELNAEFHDRKEALRNLKAQVQRLNGEYNALRKQLDSADVELKEAQDEAQVARADAERAVDQVRLCCGCCVGNNVPEALYCCSSACRAW